MAQAHTFLVFHATRLSKTSVENCFVGLHPDTGVPTNGYSPHLFTALHANGVLLDNRVSRRICSPGCSHLHDSTCLARSQGKTFMPFGGETDKNRLLPKSFLRVPTQYQPSRKLRMPVHGCRYSTSTALFPIRSLRSLID